VTTPIILIMFRRAHSDLEFIVLRLKMTVISETFKPQGHILKVIERNEVLLGRKPPDMQVCKDLFPTSQYLTFPSPQRRPTGHRRLEK
jgi:hypothetical protein